MKCLVIGAMGFVGTKLVPGLSAAGFEVFAADRPGTTANLKIDLADAEAVRGVVRDMRPDVVVNLAAANTGGSPEGMCRVNVLGLACLMNAMREFTPQAYLITFGSAAEYGDAATADGPLDESTPCSPVGPYGVTKLAATRLALGLAAAWHLDVAVLRPFNIVGGGCPKSLFVGAVIDRILRCDPTDGVSRITVGRVDTSRDFIAVEDVVEAVLRVATRRPSSGIYNVGGGRPVPIREVLDDLIQLSGRRVRWLVDPSLVRPTDPLVSYGTSEKLHKVTDFVPSTPLVDSLAAAWAFASAQYPVSGGL
jgi:GDP-4-dehydro-6-deoxy-D-mannose reductase